MANWNERLDAITRDFQRDFGELSIEQLNMKPSPGTWSIAQNIDHLIKINESYYPTFDALISKSYVPPFLARFGFIASLMGKAILNSVNPDNRRKAATFPIWEPAQSGLTGDILDRFDTHQAQLKSYVNDLHQHLLLNRIIASPANRNIVYTVGTAMEIITAHERRHLGQAQDLLAFLNQQSQ